MLRGEVGEGVDEGGMKEGEDVKVEGVIEMRLLLVIDVLEDCSGEAVVLLDPLGESLCGRDELPRGCPLFEKGWDVLRLHRLYSFK